MNWITTLVLLNAGITIALQAFMPSRRHFIFAAGAIIAILLSTHGAEGLQHFLEKLPLDVLAILLALQLYSEILIDSQIFENLTSFLAAKSSGKGWLIIVAFCLITYLVSCFMDNYQCLHLLIPPMLAMLRQINTTKRYLQIIFGLLIITSNLGGASTPIGDFPALYLLSQGSITFSSYLTSATPLLMIATVLCLITALVFYYFNSLQSSKEEEKTSVLYTKYLYRNVRINWRILLPAIAVFLVMSFLWVNGYEPTKVSIFGFLVFGLIVKGGKIAEDKIRETQASIFIYYLCLFVIVVSIQVTGVLDTLAESLLQFQDNRKLLIFLFITVATLVTGVVSAGPSTITMFPIVQVISPMFPEHMVISCFVLSICAGSSMFMTSATAGPLMAQLTEKYKVLANGKSYSYTFRDYLLPGLIGAAIIYMVNVLYALTSI